MGIYAGSDASYIKWEKLYDPIILDIHNYQSSGTHEFDMDAS